MNGILHRLDGPASIFPEEKEWWMYGKQHRLDGPAVEIGNYRREWYINNKIYSKSCHNRLVLFSMLEPKRVCINPTEE